MPSNPNMRNEKLKSVFESLGFSNVQAVISSGNLIFSLKQGGVSTKVTRADISALEMKIEQALTKKLGIKSAVFLRSQKELVTITNKDPFKGKEHSTKSYLIVTFLKKKPREIFNTVDLSNSKTPDFMRQAEKEYGKEITTRTWKTVQRMVTKMESGSAEQVL